MEIIKWIKQMFCKHESKWCPSMAFFEHSNYFDFIITCNSCGKRWKRSGEFIKKHFKEIKKGRVE